MIETKSFQSSAVYSYPFYMSRTGWEHRICGAKSDHWARTWLSGSVWPETCKFVWLNNLRSEWLLWQQAGITGFFYLLLLILIILTIIVFVTIVYHQFIIIILSLSLINVYHKLLFDKQPQSLTPKSTFFPFFLPQTQDDYLQKTLFIRLKWPNSNQTCNKIMPSSWHFPQMILLLIKSTICTGYLFQQRAHSTLLREWKKSIGTRLVFFCLGQRRKKPPVWRFISPGPPAVTNL